MYVKLFCEEVICQFSCLLESILYPTVVRKLEEVIFINEFLRDGAELNPDVFWAIKLRSKVEIAKVDSHAFCI